MDFSSPFGDSHVFHHGAYGGLASAGAWFAFGIDTVGADPSGGCDQWGVL